MKNLLILGAGTAGTMMANKMARALDRREWRITVVDRDGAHHYQPGYLFIPFGVYSPRDVVRPRQDYDYLDAAGARRSRRLTGEQSQCRKVDPVPGDGVGAPQ